MAKTLLKRYPQMIATCGGVALTTFLMALPAPSQEGSPTWPGNTSTWSVMF